MAPVPMVIAPGNVGADAEKGFPVNPIPPAFAGAIEPPEKEKEGMLLLLLLVVVVVNAGIPNVCDGAEEGAESDAESDPYPLSTMSDPGDSDPEGKLVNILEPAAD